MDSVPSIRPGGVSVTEENQILVELAPEDAGAANLFDLDGRTLTFTPDGHGGYSRSVESVTWDSGLGQPVADRAEVGLESFTFDFAGRAWNSFFVSQRGLITFGEPHQQGGSHRFSSMREVAGELVVLPTVGVLFKPYLEQHEDVAAHVAHWPDRVVITWSVTDPRFYVHGVPPERPSRFQAVLGADGSVKFSYADVALRDGVVGLFPSEGVTKGNLIASISDPTDSQLPGHLDLLEVALYESGPDTVILEFTTREPIREPTRGRYLYRLYFDTDRPYSDDGRDADLVWKIEIGGDYNDWGGKSRPGDAANQVQLVADISDLQGLSASVWAGAHEYDDNRSFVGGDSTTPLSLRLPAMAPVDLSESDRGSSPVQSEVFHYRDVPDATEIACGVIGVLGDEFDLFVFHSEFRVDMQAPAASWTGRDANVRGIGDIGGRRVEWPCGEGRIKGHWNQPLWMKSYLVVSSERFRGIAPRTRFDRGLALFAHEFTHVWTAHASYDRNGERVSLIDDSCRCHWRTFDLHLPAAFPWNTDVPGPTSLMGGGFWRDDGNGSFTRLDGFYIGDGHSWLDLYMMGLADASEVPDMFVLRNLKRVNDRDRLYTGDKEVVMIEQVIAAEGPRIPPATQSQKDFNAAFVYLLEPGKTPDPEMLALHSEFRHTALRHWYHITGGRSRMTTAVPSVGNRAPAVAGTVTDGNVRAGGAFEVEMEGLFLDADGDLLTYEATSSAPAVAFVAVAGGTVTVTALAGGTATITVTATDSSGSNTATTLTFVVEVESPPEAHRSTWRGWRLELLRDLAGGAEDES